MSQYNTTKPRYGQAGRAMLDHDTTTTPTTQRWGRPRQGATRRAGSGHGAHGTARRGASVRTEIWPPGLRHGQAWPATRCYCTPDTATLVRPGRGLCVQAGLWLCTLCTCPVFDSVLFLSHCLDTVHEHCSSQKKKKFKIFFKRK